MLYDSVWQLDSEMLITILLHSLSCLYVSNYACSSICMVYLNYILLCFVFQFIFYFSRVLILLYSVCCGVRADFHLTVSVLFSWPVLVFVSNCAHIVGGSS